MILLRGRTKDKSVFIDILHVILEDLCRRDTICFLSLKKGSNFNYDRESCYHWRVCDQWQTSNDGCLLLVIKLSFKFCSISQPGKQAKMKFFLFLA